MHRFFANIEEKDDANLYHGALSGRARVFIALGAAGAIASILGALALLSSVFGTKVVIAMALYFMILVSVIFITSGASRHWVVWPARLVAPLPMTAICWWLLSLLGL